MKTSSLFPLLTIASIAQGLPFEALDSPLTPRQTGNTGQWVDPAAAPPTPAVSSGFDSGQWNPPSTITPSAIASAVPSAAPSAVPLAVPSSTPDSAPPSGGPGGDTGGASSENLGSTQYTLYSGDGKNWPSEDKWVGDFDTMFNSHKELMKNSCTAWKQPLNSEQEMEDIRSGIIAQSQSSGVDKRVILAVILQESNGCVRVISTNLGVNNPGLMQSHNGIGCHETPCPTEKIHQMIQDGASGTTSGDGLKQTIHQAKDEGAIGAQIVYWGARIYNSGSYKKWSDLNNPNVATKCYSTDIANWLTGWNGLHSGCHLDEH